MLTRIRNGALATFLCFLATTGAFAVLSQEEGVRQVLLDPPQVVIYTTRAPLAATEAARANTAPERGAPAPQSADRAPIGRTENE